VATLATVGVYESDLEAFLDALAEAGVTLVIDVRQRRGVRGPQYAWANSARLQAALADAGIGYRHRRDLAPTTDLRRLQYAEDAKEGVGKRSRRQLATEYVRRYNEEILDAVDLGELVRTLAADGTTALLCVERDAEACHRSLIAQRIATEHGVAVIHLRP
jgi:uncharacterized protein (DUF488 family)